MNDVITEASLFTKYIVGKPSDHFINEQYISGINTLNLAFTGREENMMRMLKKRPFLLPFCDAGLAILSPHCTLRKRILLIFALVETDKNFTTDFINTNDTSFPIIRFVLRGCIGVFKAIFGIIIILVMQWK